MQQVMHPLDDPIRTSLAEGHRHFVRSLGRVSCYDPRVSGLCGHPPVLEAQDWADVAKLVGSGNAVALYGSGHVPPPGWGIVAVWDLVQMVGGDRRPVTDPELQVLTHDDVPDIMDLVSRTNPGPFGVRTIEMGSYLGVRVNGRLVAMAGERLHPPGWTEISAVCTDPEFRGRGLASRLIEVLHTGIAQRGETPFLHARADNVGALRLYRHLGFHPRTATAIIEVRVP